MSEPNKGQFAALLEEIDTLQKAMPGARVGADDPDAETEEERAERLARRSGGGQRFGKSFQVKTEDGQTMEAFDGTEMLKGFGLDLRRTQGLVGKQGTLLKSMAAALDKAEVTIASQAELIGKQATAIEAFDKLAKAIGEPDKLAKALGELDTMKTTVDNIANQGRGRKGTATVELPKVEGKEKMGMAPGIFLAKALAAAGKPGSGVSGKDVAQAEGCINNGQDVPPRLVAAVIAAVGAE